MRRYQTDSGLSFFFRSTFTVPTQFCDAAESNKASATASAVSSCHCARLCRRRTSTCLAIRAMPAIALRTMHAPQLDPHPEGRGLCFGCFSGQETKWHVMPSSVFGCAPVLYSLSLHSSNHHFLNFLFVTAIKVKFFFIQRAMFCTT